MTRKGCPRAERVSGLRTPDSRLPGGFTLIEVVIALGILAILASVLVTGADSGQPQSLEAAGRILAADLRLARSLSIQYATEWTIRFDPSGHAYELLHTGNGDFPLPESPPGWGQSTPGRYLVDLGRVGSVVAAASPVRIDNVFLAETGTTVTDVTFGPLGGTGPVRDEDTVIRLAADSAKSAQTRELVVSWVTGQVWMRQPSP